MGHRLQVGEVENLGSNNHVDAANHLSDYSALVHLQNRIAELTDYRVYGSSNENDLIHLYSDHQIESNDDLTRSSAFDHTMSKSIDLYCSQKFPVDEVERGVLNGSKFDIHGVFPDHFTSVADKLGYSEVREIPFQPNSRTKRFNFMRPKFFSGVNIDGQVVFIGAIPSGRDYVFHYANMLNHVLGEYRLQVSKALTVYRYPLAESTIHIWTQLNASLVKRGDIVLIGYVEELSGPLQSKLDIQQISEIDTPYYTSIRYCTPNGSSLNFIGVKYSFWGCIGAKLVTQICRLGAKEIIYVGKLGSLSSPNDIYSRIFVPSQFLIVYYDKVVCDIKDLPNSFLIDFPDMATGRHVSTPTILEQDYIHGAVTHGLDISSIDNEASQIAYAVARFNRQVNEVVSYTAIHIATDYIRNPSERNLEVEFDLSNNRTEQAVKGKLAAIDSIAEKLATYLRDR